MANWILEKRGLKGGVWQGLLTGDDEAGLGPDVSATWLETRLEEVTVLPDPAEGGWAVRVVLPVEMISDGVQTVLITETASGEVLDSFSLIAGIPADSDIRAELALIRDELDMLKRAFRRHCVETL